MKRFELNGLLGLGAGCLVMAAMVGCLGAGSSTGMDGGTSLSGKTKGGTVNPSGAVNCGNEDKNVDEKGGNGAQGKDVEVNDDNDSTKVGCDDKDGGGKVSGKHESDTDKDSTDAKDGKNEKVGSQKEDKDDSTKVGAKEDKDSVEVAEVGGAKGTK